MGASFGQGDSSEGLTIREGVPKGFHGGEFFEIGNGLEVDAAMEC